MNKKTADNITSTSKNAPLLELDTRSKILRAAIDAFSRSGYSGASLREITGLAGVNHGSVKYHYSNKQNLWQSAVKFLYAELEAATRLPDKEWATMSAKSKVEHGMRRYIRFLAKNPELFKITMFETMNNGPQLDWLLENVTIPYTKKSIALIDEARKDGVFFHDISTMNLFYLMISVTRNIFFIAPEIYRVFGKDVFSDEEIKRHEDAAVTLFMGHLSNTEQHN